PAVERYVLAVDAPSNRLITGSREELYIDTLRVRAPRIVDPGEFFTSPILQIKIRGLGINPQGYCRVSLQGEELTVHIPEKVYAPAKGQPVVFYIGDRVVGGGYL
ncbi:MAG: tRNA-specific 2-thiouridylase, partial [Rikenellaceae bacterium]|nr:tRNA-specific 2-thiouridylase [Rikenellaceae bacterium]